MSDAIPFASRLTCTVLEASQATGLGKTKLFELIASGRLTGVKIGKRRLVHVPSLIALVQPAEGQP